MRAIRLADSAQDDIDRQLSTDRAKAFRRHDLRQVLEALASNPDIWDESTSPHGAGRRMTLYGRTVAGFHLFGVPDTEDPRHDAIVIYFIDIWVDQLPE